MLFLFIFTFSISLETQIPFTGELLKNEYILLQATGDTGCHLNYDKPPFRLHCSLELTLGLPHFKDAVTKVEAGVEFEANDLADIANHPNMTFYFGFKSPELALEIGGTSETLVEGRTFPEDGGYYKKRVDLPGFADLGFCVLDFAKKIPEKIVEEVVDSAKWSGTDVCISGKFDKLTRDTVNVALNVQFISLDDTRIPWDESKPVWLSLCYEAVEALIDGECKKNEDRESCEQNDCYWDSGNLIRSAGCKCSESDRDIFKYVRKRATGSDSKFERDMNVGVDVLKLIKELEHLYEKGTEEWKEWKRHHESAKMLVSSDSGAFKMGDQSSDDGLSTGMIVLIVILCFVFMTACGLSYVFREKLMGLCVKKEQSDYQRMGVEGLVNKYERIQVNM